jgi:cholesterol transport system auxiliary component
VNKERLWTSDGCLFEPRLPGANLLSSSLCLLIVVFAGGCLSRPPLVKQSFAFALPSVLTNTPAVTDRVLAILRLTVEPPFDGPTLVYRTGEFSYESDHYATFLVSPAESFVAPIREYFRGNGLFRAVSDSGSALKPDILVEISVNQLYGDFRRPGQSAAVLGMQFLFFDAPNGVPGRLLLAKSYLHRLPISARTPATLVEGWNQALSQVLGSAVSDFAIASNLSPLGKIVDISTSPNSGANLPRTNGNH